jgi:hypothetical protein
MMAQNTMRLEEGDRNPRATLEDVAWITGHWRGEGFGGLTEEIWSPPLGNSMMGSYKLVINGDTKFYEFMSITEEESTLMLRIKHFHPDFRGWEPQDTALIFPLVHIDEKSVYFHQFTFNRINEYEMQIYVVRKESDGKHEDVYTYHRYRD